YGGLLQAFALQQKLKSLGHDTWIINRLYSKPGVKPKLIKLVKNIFYRHITSKRDIPLSMNEFEYRYIYGKISYFKSKFIFPITHEIYDTKGMNNLKKLDFDAFIVGSDQVWRQDYSPCITNYFLDFAIEFENIKRISYAASFGTSEFEIDQNKRSLISKLASNFDSVSVRESSGIKLCKEYLGVNAVQVLDPTMLLDVKVYKKLMTDENESASEGTLMSYFLDTSKIKQNYIDQISKELNLTPFSTMPKTKFTKESIGNFDDTVFPSVTKWLKGFEDAEFVITDSFHGCVFSILFNKPFIAIGNKRRGLSRFQSLLEKFGLEDRFLLDSERIDSTLIYKKIDWDNVNMILAEEKDKSIKFLLDNLN
ncbi:polysaccharide pyruvyl transferase family protein, partial [Flavobacterium sp. AJR]|uniref:polysaccharide pyruvyl transferase family protein n=1 Tax=Flavobacterium sp. AJR TaxID=1979369 RepID=UPI000A3D74AA